MRKTKIICTLGPAVDSLDMVQGLIENGMNCARINMSHNTHEDQLKRIGWVREASEKLGLPIPILLDTKGPEIRLKDFENGFAELTEGDEFIFRKEDVTGTKREASITFDDLYRYLKPGDLVLIDDGKIQTKVKKIEGTDIICTVLVGGKVSNHKSLNIPNVPVEMPYVSEADMKDILFGIQNNVDYMALSFVRSADDVKKVREILAEHKGERIKLISKIENGQGINNLDEIIEVSDGVMVARGDLGVEIDFAEIPQIQKEMIRKCYKQGKVVITATQMLESMIGCARPTRAEISDVANAIYDGSNVIMLSGESAAGKYPLESVRTMADIAEKTERGIDYSRFRNDVTLRTENDVRCSTIASAYCAAEGLRARAIILATRTGESARLMAMLRPDVRILACTDDPMVWRQLNLQSGVIPVLTETQTTSEELTQECLRQVKEQKMIQEGDSVVILVNSDIRGTVDTISIRTIV